MAKELTREMLWEVGAQYGHQTKRCNPKMKPYIYGQKNKVHIMDLQQTIWRLAELKTIMNQIAEKKGNILFVGTKKSAKYVVKEAAERTNNFYVTERWLGGTLTNLKTIHLRVRRLWEIEKMMKLDQISVLPKKEQIKIKKEKDKLDKFLSGIKAMRELPAALFVVDPKQEEIAVKEARKLKIPIIAICDSNVDPDMVDYVIPGNDDHYRAVSLITHHVGEMYAEAIGMKLEPLPEKPPYVKPENDGKHNKRRGFSNAWYNNRDKTIDDKNRPPKTKRYGDNNIYQPKQFRPKQPTEVLTFDYEVKEDLSKTLSSLKLTDLKTIASKLSLEINGKKEDFVKTLESKLTIKDGKISKNN